MLNSLNRVWFGSFALKDLHTSPAMWSACVTRGVRVGQYIPARNLMHVRTTCVVNGTRESETATIETEAVNRSHTMMLIAL